jgi:dihydropteroate synthase
MNLEKDTHNMGLKPHVALWRTTRFELDLSEPRVMGILNLTPDSFSDGGQLASDAQAIRLAEKMVDAGAHILDMGGESTRPGATALTHEEEWSRISGVLQQLIKWNIPISVDTYHSQTMVKALDLGVDIINDVWALRQAGSMAAVSTSQCGLCLMHMHGEPQSMQLNPMSGDVMYSVESFFNQLMTETDKAGIQRNRLVIDPGIGFGKTVDQNFEILCKQHQLLKFEVPLLTGWSNKSSLGVVSGLPVEQRLAPSLAAAVLAVERGAKILRVHAVAETVAALSICKAVRGFATMAISS